ncbi:FIG004655: Polysaccharide deacetylase [hydrothermal vent metagenome]|uniref:FIG004655: Polysaccharide deacetylase n=1 Tax=hydrothermal vent metagenome TaxID=652676 RepID=A0A3B0V974_9ZZZZ
MTQSNYLTIDVEDYFQVSAFEGIVSKGDWDSFDSRVVRNTRKILSLLDYHNVRATFFVLGWTAQKQPDLVKEISGRGHEIACHSYYHRLVYNLSPEEFHADTQQAKDILEQITGNKVDGYRAPSYSITKRSLWALDILAELGFRYDSSIFPIYHDRYGIPDAPRFSYRLPGQNMTEYPISTALFFGKKIPIAGGGYFRLFPYWFTRMALQRINKKEGKPFVFYVHPWEIDPEQPRMKEAKALSRFRHYVNLNKTYGRLRQLLHDFSFGPLGSGPV